MALNSDTTNKVKMPKDANANVSNAKSSDERGSAKEKNLRELIRKYLENPEECKPQVTMQDQREIIKIGKLEKVIQSQNERKQKIAAVNELSSSNIESKQESTSSKKVSTEGRLDPEKQRITNYIAQKPCNFFNNMGMCKFASGHFLSSGSVQQVHICRFCFISYGEKNPHPEGSCGQLEKKSKLLRHGSSVKIADLDVLPEGTYKENYEMGHEIATKLTEPRVDMVIAVVKVIGREAALRIFKKTQEVESGGGMMIKNGARRRTAGGTFFQLVRENGDPQIDQEKVNSVFEQLNDPVKLSSKNAEMKGNVKLDRPCDYFNDFGRCKYTDSHYSQSGFTRRIHTCRYCFYNIGTEIANGHSEVDCRFYQSYAKNSTTLQSFGEGSDKIKETNTIGHTILAADDKSQTGPDAISVCANTSTSLKSFIENSDKIQRICSVRQATHSAIGKMLTGSNALPIGNRFGQTVEKTKHGRTREPENMGRNSSRSETNSDLGKFGDQHCRKTFEKKVEFQDGASKQEETQLNKAKQNMLMLPQEKLKPILKKESSVKSNKLAVKNKDDLKVKPQNDKAKKQQRSSVQGLHQNQDKDEQNEKIRSKAEQKIYPKEIDQNEVKTIDITQQQHHDKVKTKEKSANKKHTMKQDANNDGTEQKEKSCSINVDKEKVAKEIHDKSNYPVTPMKIKNNENVLHLLNSRGQVMKKNEQKEKLNTKVVKNKKQDCDVGQKFYKSKSEIRMSSFNLSAASSFHKNVSIKGKPSNMTKGKGYGKERLHCPCPPYCPSCLKIVSMTP